MRPAAINLLLCTAPRRELRSLGGPAARTGRVGCCREADPSRCDSFFVRKTSRGVRRKGAFNTTRACKVENVSSPSWKAFEN